MRTILLGTLLASLLALGSGPLAAEPFLKWVPAGTATVASQPDDLAARTTALAHQGRWSDVVSICETAARKGTLDQSLSHQYDLAKLHCDIARRHA